MFPPFGTTCFAHKRQMTLSLSCLAYSAHTYAVAPHARKSHDDKDKMTSALSVGAQVHATRRPYGARVEGALHMRRRKQRMRMLPPAVLE